MKKEEIKKLLKENKIVIGKRETEKMLHKGKISKIVLASNATEDIKRRYLAYKKAGIVDVETLRIDSEQLGIVCKKPFTIMVLGIKNE